MKRVFIIFTLLFSIVLKVDAQIYTSKCVMDKFDDVLLAKELKTIIIQTDSTFIIEEKRKRAYRIYYSNILRFNW